MMYDSTALIECRDVSILYEQPNGIQDDASVIEVGHSKEVWCDFFKNAVSRPVSGFRGNISTKRQRIAAHEVLILFSPASTSAPVYFIASGNIDAGGTDVNEIPSQDVDELSGVLSQIYIFEQARRGRVASQLILDFVEKSFARRDIDSVNNFLARIDPSKLDVWSLIGLIRSTARANKVLPSWSTAYAKCRHAISEKGIDPNKMYVGIQDAERA